MGAERRSTSDGAKNRSTLHYDSDHVALLAP
jgi:hypothetical protein